MSFDVAGKIYATVDMAPSVRRARTLLELHPQISMAVQAAEAPTYQGFPRVPRVWFRLSSLFSARGQYLSARPIPQEIELDSDIRFLPTTLTNGVWESYVGNAEMVAPIMAAPVLEELSYLSASELITRPAFRIADGDYFSFTGFSYTALTMSLVVMLNPGGDYPILDQLVDPEDERLALWATDKIDYHFSDTGGSVDQVVSLAKARPMAITIVINPPTVTTYVSYSPRHHFSSTKVSTNAVHGRSLEFALGSSFAGGSADYWLMELNLWDKALESVSALHDTYFSSYGVHSDWT